MFTFYIIPKDAYCVEQRNMLSWEKTNEINPLVPTCIVINDSIITKRIKFFVAYLNRMQSPGGSGACLNPLRKNYWTNEKNVDPMDNSKMPAHMSKWVPFDWTYLYEMVAYVKFGILQSMGYKDSLPFFFWNCEFISLPGILIAQLDAIGMRHADPSVIKEVMQRRKRLALPCGK